MKTAPRGFHDEEHVGDSLVDIANMVGVPTSGPPSVGGDPSEPTVVIESHRGEKEFADPIFEDGINPDDAPEVVLADTDEEGEETTPSMLGRLGRPKCAADAMKEMEKRQVDFLGLDLGTMRVASKKTKKPAPQKDNGRSQKNQRNKSNKKKRDKRLVEESILRMRTSTSSSRSERRASQHQRIATPRQSGLDQEERDRHAFQASTIECPSHVLPLQGQSAPTTPPSVTPTTGAHGPPILFADSDHTPCAVNLGPVEQVAISGGPEMVEAEIKKVPLLAHNEGTICASQESVENVSDFPLTKADSDKNGADAPTSSISTGSDATQSIVAEREKARMQDNRVLATPHSGLLVGASTNWYPRDPYDSDIEADQEDMQMDFSTAMDKDDDESDPGFGVLPNTTFHPLLAYQPHLYGHGPNLKQDDPIVEDTGSGLGADSAMEDATTESRKVDVPATATRTLQPFSWVPTSTFDAFRAIFPGIPIAHPQMTTFIDDSVPGFQHRMLTDPYGVDAAISEETRIQQTAPPQDIAWPFVSDGAHPSPSVKGRSSKGLQFVHAKHSSTSGSTVFPSQTISHPCFPSPSPPTSKVDPVPISSPTCRPIELQKEEVKDLEGEIYLEPSVIPVVQREASPPSNLFTPNVVRLNVSASQWRIRSSPAISDVSLPLSSPLLAVDPLLSSPLLAVDTTAFNHSAPTDASLIEHNEHEIEGKNRHYTNNDHSADVHAIAYTTLATARLGTKTTAPPIAPVATAKPPPPVPPRIVGSKRKFVDDQRPRYNSINPARKISKLPRSKRPKIEHGDYSTHKRLGEVKAMHRREGEGITLPEAIEFATRHAMPIWSSSRTPTRHQQSGGAANWAA